jgi:predicted RND superfamily exporter protein
MPGSVSRTRAERFADWLDHNRVGIVVLSVLVAVLGGYLASRMAIKSDIVNLLPPTQRSVRDLMAVQQRARPFGTVQVVIESTDLARRARGGAALSERLARLAAERPDLVTQFSADDGPLHRYVWQHRFLFADLADLTAARDALQARIDDAKLRANPLYVPLDDDEDDPGVGDELAELESQLAELEAKATAPPPRVSADGTLQLLVVQTTFAASDPDHTRELIGLVRSAIADVRRALGPGPRVSFGLSGNVTFGMYEHDSVLQNMAMSGTITVILCAFALLLYYRSGKIVLAMLWSLAVGVAATFAAAWGIIGHLNVMTAFLTAIVVGNGINASLILVARYQEEIRGGLDPRAAMAPAIAGALQGTLAATATAAVAYTALLVTEFRGFRQFGAIAGLGMGLTWITTFTILPAILFILARRGRIKLTRSPAVGNLLARLMPHRRKGLVATMAIGGVITAIAAVITLRYIVNDPFTHDWRDLQSSTPEIRAARTLDAKVKAAFDPKSLLSGSAYQLAIAVEHREEVAPVVALLRAADADRRPDQKWIHDVRTIDDLIPLQQPEKLAVVEKIQELIDDPNLQATLEDDDRAKLAKLRPPDHGKPIADADVPHDLAWPFIEKGGSIGRLIIVRGAKRFDSFDVDHRLEFAAEVRKLELPAGTVIAGESLIVADIIRTMEEDAPNMVAFALAGSVLAVFFVLGLRRHGLVTLACGFAGVIVMIAVCALVGLKVHFLDLIALPITIGIGVDYAVNLAARDRQDGQRGPHHLLRTTGATVLLCSYTTAVGYGTLMLSANGGIRAFGEAALIGELACITMALMIAPAWLTLLRERDVARENPQAMPAPEA